MLIGEGRKRPITNRQSPITNPYRWVTLSLTLGVAAPAGAQDVAPDTGGLPPAGFGTLRQEDVAIRLETATLQIRALPLDERVIRLLAPDTYGSLHRLLQARRSEVEAAASRYGLSRPALFLVTFHGLQDQARFEPEILSVTSQNRLFRPVEMLPLSPLWSSRQLHQRETATAIYLYEDGIRVLDPLVVSYGTITSTQWERILRTLDRERASVLARAARERGQ